MQRFRTEETATTASEAHYDSEAVREVLARAAAIEQSEAQARADKVSAAQIETLGRELGISPDAVRRALQERQAPAVASPHRHSVSNRLAPLTKLDFKAAFAPGVCYAPFLALYLTWFFLATRTGYEIGTFWQVLTAVLLFFITPLIAGLYGWRTRDYRKGLIMGAAGTILPGAMAILIFWVTLGRPSGSGPFFSYIFLNVGAGIFLGGVGGALSGWWHTLRDSDER